MPLIARYVVLKYLADIRPLTPLILTKTSKKEDFWQFFSNRVRFPDNTVRTDGGTDKIIFLKPIGLNSASIHILLMHIPSANFLH